MTRPVGVPREFYDDAVRQRDLALERARVAEDRLAAIVTELAELKRHDVGASPRSTVNLDRLDPEYGLGGETLLVIDDVASGDVQLRAHQLTRAHTLLAAAKAAEPGMSPDDLDKYVAHILREGDAD